MNKIAYLHAVDEDALGKLLHIRRVGNWDGELPIAIVLETCRVKSNESCAVIPARGSVSAYAALEAMREPVSFEDGVLIPGLQYLPLAAFHDRMYDFLHIKLAEVLVDYDRIIARPFEFGKPRRPLGSLGVFPVEDYGGWFGRGHTCEEYVVWEVVRSEPMMSMENARDIQGWTAAAVHTMRDGEHDEPDDPFADSDG